MAAVVRLATRRSALALWQAHHVAGLLKGREPGLEVQLVELVTQGDRILDRPLAQVGGKGLFVKEIEDALLRGEADLAVHSLKDMPAAMPEGLVLGAVPAREDVSDALVSPAHRTLDAMPKGARIGTSSLRRGCQLLALRPDLQVVSIRGNVPTRVEKVRTEGLDGVVLALAGLRRLGLESHVTEVLGPPRFLPAVGQGALGLQCRSGDGAMRGRLEALAVAEARIAVDGERAFLSALEGNCQVPLAAHGTVANGRLTLHALVGRPDGSELLRESGEVPVAEAEALGRALAERLLARGARELLDAR